MYLNKQLTIFDADEYAGLTLTWDVFKYASKSSYTPPHYRLTLTWDVFKLLIVAL